MELNLNELRNKIHENAINKGFWDSEPAFATMIMLVVTELAEAVEADRNEDWNNIHDTYSKKLNDNEVHNSMLFARYVKDTVQDEMADAIIRILDICGRYQIDIQEHILQKMEYNAGRPRLHGKEY